MNRKSRFLLGLSVALLTASALHLTIGNQYHERYFGHYGPHGWGRTCAPVHQGEKFHDKPVNNRPPQPL